MGHLQVENQITLARRKTSQKSDLSIPSLCPMARAREEIIVMFPYLAQGHFIPFLALATQIIKTTPYKVILVNTRLNIKKIQSSLPTNTSIQFAKLPFCSNDHGLPPNSESTDVLPSHLVSRLLEASQSLKPHFHQLIQDIITQQDQPPFSIISDMSLSWTIDIANHFNIFHTLFMTSNAYSMAIYYSLWTHLPHSKTDSEYFSLPDIPHISTLHRSQLAKVLQHAVSTDSFTIAKRDVLCQWWKSDALFIHTIEELDQKGLEYFRTKMGGRPVWPIVPTLYDSNITRPQTHLEECLNWQDTKPPASVLFVCFGSQNTLSSTQMMELATALEKSGKNFIWAMRPPVGFDINGEFNSDWLPEGFEERVKEGNSGFILHRWAPQVEILSHKSTCAFLSHCGWNSSLESLSNGVPIIGWPLAGEQFYNSKLLEEEMGVSIEVCRGNSNASGIKHEELVRVIDLVMGGTEKGEEMKKKAYEAMNIVKTAVRDDKGLKGSSVKAMNDFIRTALSKNETRERKTIS